MEIKGQHVVLLPYPSQGHINPLLQFAKRLASKGLKATLATTLHTFKSVYAPNVEVEPISDGFDEGGFAQVGNENLYLESFKANGSRTLSQLIQKYQYTDSPVVFIVYDSFLPWALDVAKQHGINGGPFFTNSAAVCSIYCHIANGLLTLPVTMEDTPVFLRGLPPLNYRDLPSFLKLKAANPAYLAMKSNQYCNLDQADWIFENSFEELEGKEAQAIRELWPAKLIGPMVPSAYLDDRIEGDKGYGASLWKPLSPECAEWLKTRRPESVVYVSFGSMVSLTTEQIQEIAWGLKECDFPFLFILRESEHAKLPSGFMDSLKEKGLVVTWCNQLEVLSNRAIGCFVTHCGWNSTLEGLSLGMPFVAMPQWSDQLTDAKYIDEIWKVGIWPKEDDKGVVRKEEIIKSLKGVMEGERSREIKKNAAIWRQRAKEAASEGGSSDKRVNEFVKYLETKKANEQV